MCGRYAIQTDLATLCQILAVSSALAQSTVSDNASPGMDLPIIIKNRIGHARWGVPLPGQTATRPMINVRSETVHQKPSFRADWARGRRCLIPITHFYEWGVTPNGQKQKYQITQPNQSITTLAGLWTVHDGQPYFAVLTRAATGEAATIHARYPCIIHDDQRDLWIKTSPEEAQKICFSHAILPADIRVCAG